MEALLPVEPERLSHHAVYQIDGCLYSYTGTEKKGKNVKFQFQPLARQRKQSPLSLTSQKLFTQVMEVPSMYGKINHDSAQNTVQLSLF